MFDRADGGSAPAARRARPSRRLLRPRPHSSGSQLRSSLHLPSYDSRQADRVSGFADGKVDWISMHGPIRATRRCNLLGSGSWHQIEQQLVLEQSLNDMVYAQMAEVGVGL